MLALLKKEWREHRWVLLAMLLVLAIAQLVLLMSDRWMGSPMVAYQKLVATVAPPMALILVSRLVVREYMGRTQLFLETLPVNRAQVIGLKWLFGAAVLLLSMAACLGVTLLAARGHVALTPHFISLVAIRSASFLFFAYALAFAVGLTGRYRYVLWGMLLVGAILADSAGQVAAAQWPPFYLVQQSMVYELLRLPLRPVLITCAIAVMLVAATFVLALSSQGSLVVALSRRMTPREKSGVTISILVLLMAFSVIEVRKPKPAFELKRAVHSSSNGPAVAVGIAGAPARAQALADILASDLARLQSFLALPLAPALSALPDDALDGDAFQRAALPNADGVVVRAAFTHSEFDREGFRAFALAAWLQWYSRGSAAAEERRWLLDGAAQWLVARDLPQQQDKLALRAAFAARLLQARRRDAGSAVRQWLSVREELGACLGDALAWRMVSSLVQRMGEERFQALARTALAVRPPDDARASLFEPSFAQLLATARAPDQAELARHFTRLFSAEQTRLAGTLNQIAMPKVSFTARPMEGSAYEVHYQVDTDGVALPFSVRYATLDPWDLELAPEVLARVDTNRDGVLPASFARGVRLFTALERRDALLGCNVRLAAQRWVVQ